MSSNALDRALAAVRSPEGKRVVETLAQHVGEHLTYDRIAELASVSKMTVRRTLDRLDAAGVTLHRRRPDASHRGNCGWEYSLGGVPLNRSVHPECSPAIPVSIPSVHPPVIEVSRNPSSGPECSPRPMLASSQVGTSLEYSKGVSLSPKSKHQDTREGDLREIQRRLGPISQHAFATLNESLDLDRRGVVQVVKDIEGRVQRGGITNPVGLLVKSLRDGDHIGKRPPVLTCQACGHPQPTARYRPQANLTLCDSHWTNDYAPFYGERPTTIATTGGVR